MIWWRLKLYVIYVKKISQKLDESNLNYLTLLILGDITDYSTQNMLGILYDIESSTYKNNVFIFKSHPANPSKLKTNYSKLIIKTELSLEHLFFESNCIITTVNSASAIEAYAAGIPVITILDDQNLNASPLRGMKDCNFVSNAERTKACNR